MRALAIVHESTGRSLVREFYPMRFLFVYIQFRYHCSSSSESVKIECSYTLTSFFSNFEAAAIGVARPSKKRALGLEVSC
jgi:hypothetical protein